MKLTHGCAACSVSIDQENGVQEVYDKRFPFFWRIDMANCCALIIPSTEG